MNWLKRARKGIRTWRRKSIPEGLWKKCPSCGEIVYSENLQKNLSVCSNCGNHFRISPDRYLEILFDRGSFEESDPDLSSSDPLKFKDSKKYPGRIKNAQKKTSRKSAVLTGTAELDGNRVALAIMDFSFLGGSMGSVVGEKIARIARKAIEQRIPFLMVSASGGARMQESILSLMQMAKTSAAVNLLEKSKLPFISILTNPTTGGVAASFAFQGDIIIAEPRALIGFAGPRVIKETVGEELPEGFQR
ncbi:MAG: acetyl-CoA carboxylase carboxyltransferase subunit beta [Candidatus Latescibacteria bacterium]|nr:acetyl-CoA carboxylase carboxyltransferase subunit beta [bacterium]MBD3425045.1 acetyl-CoA carboxylase carboxyltransferase subunit beta [Candidatus Latescibacterota bacterium]